MLKKSDVKIKKKKKLNHETNNFVYDYFVYPRNFYSKKRRS